MTNIVIMEPGESEKAFQGCFICIKNDLIEIVLLSPSYFNHFLLVFITKPYDFRSQTFHAVQ